MRYGDSKHGIQVYYCRNAAFEAEIRSELLKAGLEDEVEIEAVPCSGRIDPRYILKSLEAGACGVCVLGCQEGNCLLMEGNLRAARRIQTIRSLLTEAGMNPAAVQIFLHNDRGESIVSRMTAAISKLVKSGHRPVGEVVAR